MEADASSSGGWTALGRLREQDLGPFVGTRTEGRGQAKETLCVPTVINEEQLRSEQLGQPALQCSLPSRRPGGRGNPLSCRSCRPSLCHPGIFSPSSIWLTPWLGS